MEFLFGVLSVFCLVYYGVILVYSGVETSFSFIWLILAFCLAAMAVFAHILAKYRDRVPLRLEVSVITMLTAFFVIFVFVEAAMGISIFSLKKTSSDYVIVLGAQVKGTKMSKSLEFRMEKALEYASVHPNTVLILSGGQGEGEDMSEAEAMYQYLKDHGIPESQMIKEEQSHSTHENLAYSRLIIEDRENRRMALIKSVMASAGYLVPPEEDLNIRVGIITSNFHILRAKGIAAKMGISNVSGIAAKSDPVLFIHFCVRECFAILKDKFVGNM